jgi:hypothetical protein
MSGITHSQTPVRQMLARDQRRAKRVALATVSAIAALLVALALSLGGGDSPTPASSAQPAVQAPQPAIQAPQQPPGVRYDGGPEEGTAAIAGSSAPGQRYDGGPDEGTRGPGH